MFLRLFSAGYQCGAWTPVAFEGAQPPVKLCLMHHLWGFHEDLGSQGIEKNEGQSASPSICPPNAPWSMELCRATGILCAKKKKEEKKAAMICSSTCCSAINWFLWKITTRAGTWIMHEQSQQSFMHPWQCSPSLAVTPALDLGPLPSSQPGWQQCHRMECTQGFLQCHLWGFFTDLWSQKTSLCFSLIQGSFYNNTQGGQPLPQRGWDLNKNAKMKLLYTTKIDEQNQV